MKAQEIVRIILKKRLLKVNAVEKAWKKSEFSESIWLDNSSWCLPIALFTTSLCCFRHR